MQRRAFLKNLLGLSAAVVAVPAMGLGVQTPGEVKAEASVGTVEGDTRLVFAKNRMDFIVNGASVMTLSNNEATLTTSSADTWLIG